MNIQVDDEDHYSPYPTVADDISVALPLMDDESPKEERNGKKQTGPADYRYLPGNDPPGVKSGDRRQILNRPIPAIHYMIAAAGGNSIPCAPYATFGTRELSEHVAVALKHRKATLLQHHGLIACEASLEKALWLAHEVEVLAQLYLSTLAITDPVPVLDDEAIAIVLEKFKTYGLRIEE